MNRFTPVQYFFVFTVTMTVLFFAVSWVVFVLRRHFFRGNVLWVFQKWGDWRGNVVSAFFGMITPFCSCTTVPIFSGLLESGVPYGVAVSFLIASPSMNIGAFILLLVLFGIRESILYGGACFVTAILVGLLLQKRNIETEVRRSFFHLSKKCVIDTDTSWDFSWRALKHFFPLLLISATMGALLYQWVPTEWLLRMTGNNAWWVILPAVLIGAVLYADIIVILPFGYALLEKGVNNGIVFAFMIAVAGISLPSTLLLSKILNVRALFTLIGTLLVLYMAIGYLLYFF